MGKLWEAFLIGLLRLGFFLAWVPQEVKKKSERSNAEERLPTGSRTSSPCGEEDTAIVPIRKRLPQFFHQVIHRLIEQQNRVCFYFLLNEDLRKFIATAL